MTARWWRPAREGESETLATDARHRWIDRVALGPDGVVAWSAGKQAFVRNAKGEIKSLDLPSSIGGLAFAPKGLRLAIAHYGGVSLWFPNAQAAPEMLAWKGSHLDALFSPDGKFLVTAMQESTLHGWRLMDGKDMRMSGYSGKVRSMAFTPGGKWLATSGLRATHPLAVRQQGRSDGQAAAHGASRTKSAPSRSRAIRNWRSSLSASRTASSCSAVSRAKAEILAKTPGEGAVSALAWSADGAKLAFGTEAGEAGIVDLA